MKNGNGTWSKPQFPMIIFKGVWNYIKFFPFFQTKISTLCYKVSGTSVAFWACKQMSTNGKERNKKNYTISWSLVATFALSKYIIDKVHPFLLTTMYVIAISTNIWIQNDDQF